MQYVICNTIHVSSVGYRIRLRGFFEVLERRIHETNRLRQSKNQLYCSNKELIPFH